MHIIHSDAVFRVDGSPNYTRRNTLLRLLSLMEETQLAAARQTYFAESLQFLFPFDFLELFGPAGADKDQLDVTQQDNKTDFQKQNLRDFRITGTRVVRGWARTLDGRKVPFVRLSYEAGPDSTLARANGQALGESIRVWLKVGENQGTLVIPYNERSATYSVELWGDAGGELRPQLDLLGQAAFDRGELISRPDLIRGRGDDFPRDGMDDVYMLEIVPDHAMHPLVPLHIELAWANDTMTVWDNNGGSNYHFEFNMIVRGWDAYLAAGVSGNPHGGVGFLEYRNLLSKYGRYQALGGKELGRKLQGWNTNGYGSKAHGNAEEPFMTVEYMDLHIMKPECGIGLHRHRDNQEIFLMMEGRGYMVVGDWLKMDERDRCFEIRTLRSGHFAMLKGGQLHGLMNPSDEDASLFMFGGYD